MLRPYRSWGLLAVLSALACGGKATEHQRESPVPTDPAVPDPVAVGGHQDDGAGANAGAAPPAGGTDTCAGVEPSCAPGASICDPRLGVTAKCNDCGAPKPVAAAQRCARLIASDKASNLVCVVLGATELQCWTTRGTPSLGVVPADSREIFLNDDNASAPQAEVHPCVRTESDEYSCFPGILGITRVAVGDWGACAISDDKVVCREGATAPGVPPDPVLDVTITDNTVFTLGPAGFAPGDWQPRMPDFWRGTPRSLHVDHQEAGCMVSTLDEMACWANTATSAPFERSAWSGYRKWLPMTLPQACVLDAQGRIGCGNVLEDAAPTWLDATNVIDLAASASLVCALTREGHVQCWNAAGAALEVPEGW